MKAKLFIFTIFLILFVNCKKDNPTPGPTEVFMTGNMFTPTTLSVTKGTTVMWTNKETVTHTVTSNSNIFNSGDLGNTKTFSFTFTTAGNFPYHCNYHSGMTGTVIVQ